MIAVLDYGVGNLFSLTCSLAAVGAEAVVTSDADAVRRADRIILPGVGAFADAAEKLRRSGLGDVLKEEAAKGKPVLGICLGMQLLFEKSFEYGEHEGLGLMPGRVVPIARSITQELKIPHMGWNALTYHKPCAILRDVPEGSHVYFVHSYHAVDCGDSLAATAEYEVPITAVVQRGSVFGCQFHPEKSGQTGLRILRAFAETEGASC